MFLGFLPPHIHHSHPLQQFIYISMDSIRGDHSLEVTVIACDNFLDKIGVARLKKKVGVARKCPFYVCLYYAASNSINIPSTDQGILDTKIPLPDKSFFPIIQGQRIIKFVVSKKIDYGNKKIDPRSVKSDYVGSGEILLDKVLSLGYHDYSWPLRKGNNILAGQLRVILHYPSANANKCGPSSSPPPPPPAGYPQYFATPTPVTPHAHAHPLSPHVHFPPYPPCNHHLLTHPPYSPTPPPCNCHLPPHQSSPTHWPYLHHPPTPPSNHTCMTKGMLSGAALAHIASTLLQLFGS